MATNQSTSLTQSRRDSTESTASCWEKTYERFPQTQQDAPFANDEKSDSLEQNAAYDDNDDDATDSDALSPITKTLSMLNINEQSKPWETPMIQDQLIIIINDDENSDDVKRSLKNDFSKQGLKWTVEEEALRPWHFGLTSICLQFKKPQIINIQMVSLSSPIPFWIKLKTEKQKNTSQNNTPKKLIRHNLTQDLDVSLRYGALTDLNQFYYSPKHSWKNMRDSPDGEDPIWSLFLDNQHNGGQIEWVIQNSKMRRKKQLLISNIKPSIIVDANPENFHMYICQKCNMNEFEANANMNGNNRNYTRKNSFTQNNSHGSRDTSRNFEQRPFQQRARSQPRPAQLLCPQTNKPQQQPPVNYEYYHRVGVQAGSYFPTAQFSLGINPFRLKNNNSRNIQNRIKQTLSLLIEFFLAHKITVCYGKINLDVGPDPYLFFQPSIPHFPSLIMKYSWQMLSSIGYRLQLQIDQMHFLQRLNELSVERHNPDELFYRVCVYLSRIFSLKPFLNIDQELQHAITESKRKRDDSAYGFERKIDLKGDNEAYIPSVTLTPTTIRIKPLKLCRTNRVLRATKQFGKALEHFILVDIRDENGRQLQSFHFHDLHLFLLKYLKNGFTLMDDGREYQYLHHSQSQLRTRQFWFYHHDGEHPNLSFPDAYLWMGNFDKEKNPATHAARIALCFSTTKATIEVPPENVRPVPDIMTNDGRLAFTDGCGTMSIKLRNKIKKSLRMRNDFSAVQFRYDGAKGVVSIHPDMPQDIHLHIRPKMKKFDSEHTCFEVCKVSAPRSLYLNRQAILLLSYRQIPDASFLVLQQQYHLSLIRALLRNSDAENLILQKAPFWFLPKDIHYANIDFIHEPFFRQLLITSCLQSTKELLQRTRIRIPPNKGRNMMGIVDEYNVLKSDQVYIQYTILTDRDSNDDIDDNNEKTKVLNDRKVVITKNPCHHPGDIRTFTAVKHPRLKHLKDVIVFSQQGDRPAPHDISGSDLDGDEYLVVWHEDLVPYHTENARPYDFDSQTSGRTYDQSVTRDDINDTILNIAEKDCLGRLSNLHLAFADKFGVDNEDRPAKDVLSTVELAGAISREVDSGKTDDHPLNENEIKELNNVLGNKRPDYMENPNCEQYKSDHILGKLYCASKETIPGWNRLLRYHRHLRHLQVRTRDEPEKEEEGEEQVENNDAVANVNLDQSLMVGVNVNDRAYPECVKFATELFSVYRQEILEILNLYGLSHESDLWCRNSINSLTGEFEDTAYTELEQLVSRTKDRFFLHQIIYCEVGKCSIDTPMLELCNICRKRQQSIAVACYQVCYSSAHMSEQAPILSLPWLFATYLLRSRIDQEPSPSNGLLGTAMGKALDSLVVSKRRLRLEGLCLQFKTPEKSLIGKANVDVTVCAFIEILQECIGSKNYPRWSLILSRFVRYTTSFALLSPQPEPTDEWELILRSHKTNKYDEYAGLLRSIDWTEIEDKSIHNYFQSILDICFDEGRRTNDIDALNISENIILLLQKMAINETIV